MEEARQFGQQLIGITQHFGQFTVKQATALAMQFRQYLAQQRGQDRK